MCECLLKGLCVTNTWVQHFFLHNVLINLIFQLHNYDWCVYKGISLSDMESYLKGQYSTYSMFLVVSTNNPCGM